MFITDRDFFHTNSVSRISIIGYFDRELLNVK